MGVSAPLSWNVYMSFGMGNLLENIIKIYHPVLSRISPFFKNLTETNLKRSSAEWEEIRDISGLRREQDYDCCHRLAGLRQIRQRMPDEFKKSIPVTKELLLVLLSFVQCLEKLERRVSTLQTLRSVKKEEEEMLQVPEQKSPCSLW